MRIVFVRHGHPNYTDDCLTDLGRRQAAAAAARLGREGIDEIFSSSCGRAKETAAVTAAALGKDVTLLDFMRELRWGGEADAALYEDGHPWRVASHAMWQGYALTDESFLTEAGYAGNRVFDEVERVRTAADGWLSALGYLREGFCYRVTGEETDRTVALFSHGGSSAAVLSHLLNLPFLYVCGIMRADFTAVTVITLSGDTGSLAIPRVELLNDARHIRGIEAAEV